MPESLTLVSLNIEGKRHLNKVLPFLIKVQPDVVLLQEIFRSSFRDLARRLQMPGYFAPLVRKPTTGDETHEHFGLAFLTKLPRRWERLELYAGEYDEVPYYEPNMEKDDCVRRGLLVAELAGEDKLRFITTKFTWSPNGQPNDEQLEDLPRMMEELKGLDGFVLAGDFNAPRGGVIFDQIANEYQDNIPPEIVSTIDPVLHKTNGLSLVVDGLFTTPHYVASNVRVIPGVSDHCAIVAKISKVS